MGGHTVTDQQTAELDYSPDEFSQQIAQLLGAAERANFTDQLRVVLAAVEAVTQRAEAIADDRRERGKKTFTNVTADLLRVLGDRLFGLASLIGPDFPRKTPQFIIREMRDRLDALQHEFEIRDVPVPSTAELQAMRDRLNGGHYGA